MTRSLGRRQFIGLLLGSVLAPYGAMARAAVDPAETYVSRIADEVMNLANSGQKGDGLRGRFSSLLSRYISLRNIANYALGTYRSQLPAGPAPSAPARSAARPSRRSACPARQWLP